MNEIGYIREKVGLTQEEAAKLLGISRRSYQQYETEHQKVYTYKYKYFLEVEDNHLKIKLPDKRKIKKLIIKIINEFIILIHTI